MVAIIAFALPCISMLAKFFSGWFFFNETGFSDVFTTVFYAKAGSGFCCAFLLFIFCAVNLRNAHRLKFPAARMFSINNISLGMRNVELLQRFKPLSLLAALLLALLAANWGASQWEKVMLFINRVDFGTAAPVVGIDLGFFFFTLPALEMVSTFSTMALLSATVLCGVVYYLRSGIQLSEQGIMLDEGVRRHLAVLVGLYSLTVSCEFFMAIFRLLLAGNGIAEGAGYSDVNARVPTLVILTIATPLAGAILSAGIWRASRRLIVIPLLVVVAIYVLGIKIYPTMLQKFKVAPNELALEMPYIDSNIKLTRFGYDLDKIETVPFDVDNKLTAADISANDATIKNIRLWDHAPLLKTYSQLQQIRTYYKFFDVDNDRYLVNGQYTQVMLSPRELSYADLPSRNWINERLIFTHGNGITFGPVSRISKEGLPEFFVKDIPPVSLADIKVNRPEIYFGELSNEYVIVTTKVPEFSYPTATGNITTTYSGKGGVALDSLLTQALFAIRFKTEKILLSTDITSKSRILYNRNINQRVKALAPFLRFDSDPYLVVTSTGRLSWIIDAYTFSSRLPYAKPARDGVNYIRNSVKAVVDAYDGSVKFYVSDQQDAIIRAYRLMFPGMFKPMAAMPEDLRRHVRYPHNFLQLQAAMFSAYHMSDPKVFYNKENLWQVPALGEKPMEPYYTIMKLPGEKVEEYILLLPFTPSKRDNLVAWLTARCDEPNYGKIRAYTFPRDRLIYGPKQIDARINQDSFISQQLTLWNQRGSEVIRGSMLVIPIEKSLLYVQPLFLAADKAALPELKRVLVAFGDQVVMEENLELALQRLFGGKKEPVQAALPVMASPAPAGGDQKTGNSALAREAMGIYEKAMNLQRQGNWAGYGDELRKLEQVLRRMAQ